MRRNWLTILCQETTIQETKDRMETFNIFDPTAMGDEKVRSVTLFLSGQESSKDSAGISGKFDVGIYWTDSRSKIYENSYASSIEAAEKYESLKAELKEIQKLDAADLKTPDTIKHFFNNLEKKEKKPLIQEPSGPITTTQASYHDESVELIVASSNVSIVCHGGEYYAVPSASVKIAQVQKDKNVILESFDRDGITLKHDDGREITIPATNENILAVASALGWGGNDIHSAASYLPGKIGEAFDDTGFFK